MVESVSSANLAGMVGTPQTTITDSAMSRDDFLELLMAQIKYQDPMSPMDNTEFVNQLTQFSILEQNMNMSELQKMQLQLLQINQSLLNNSGTMSLLGREVTIAGDRFTLEPGRNEQFYFETDAPGTVELRVRDADGVVVDKVNLRAKQGYNSYTFDGKDLNGHELPAGFYTVEVVRANGETGEPEFLQTYVTGVVRGVDFSGEEPVLDVDGVTVPANGVIIVNEA